MNWDRNRWPAGRRVKSPHIRVAFRVRAVFESPVFSIRHTLGLALLLLLTACRVSDHRTPDTPVSAADPAGSVWVVDAPKTGGRVFLCGTIHILREDDYPLSPAYEAAYANTDRVVFELPPGAGEDSAMTTRMRELGQYPADGSLESSVKPETWDAVKKWAASRGIEASSLNRFRPWFVALLITSSEYAALGAKPQWGVDNHFEARTKRDGKPASGLETVEFQLQLFAGLTPDQQQEMLEQTLGEVSTLPQEYASMIESWKHGRLDELGEMLFREQAKFPDLMDLFLFNRNQAWMGRLEEMLQKGEKVMLLVGTGHFAAEKGLIELLKARGYKVRHYSEAKGDL
ncbi:TraB/GumN family protein [Prosthecobacter algae]|uniref:TraB/GumN family protein n=1 Tax=Prosthecobacter algae TaxID=1144682 RepID=UPI0031E52E11